MTTLNAAQFSDTLVTAALGVFALALVAYAVAAALPSSRHVRAKVPVSVTGYRDESVDTQPGTSTEPPNGLGRAAAAITILGTVLVCLAEVARGLAAGRAPWGNMYEFVAAVTLVGVVAWLVVLFRRPGLRRLGVFVLLPVILLMFLGGTVLYTQAAPVVPALRSYWLAIHVTAAVISSGILLFAGVASVLYLLRSAHDSSGRMAWTSRLPEASVLDRVAYRATAVAFPIWTFAVITGAIWAEAAWGRYWGWDPKETTAFIAWVVYAGYLHARSTAGWRGQKAAAVNVVGFAVMSFNLFFVNLVVTGLHSYAGVG